MKRFIFKLVVFCLIFFVFDKLFIPLKNYSPILESDNRLELLMDGKINKDIIIIGSSRGARDIIASQIERETGQTAYNLSYDASALVFHEFILRTLVKFNKAPKKILLVIDDESEFLFDKPTKFRLDRLYPLVKYSHIQDELIDRGEKNKYLSALFVLHQLHRSNFNLRKRKFSPVDTIMACGSMPLWPHNESRAWQFKSNSSPRSENKQDNNKLEALKRFLERCDDYDIDLFLVFPPNYKPLNRSCLNTLQKIVGNRGHLYVYNIRNPIYLDKMYFYDENHLRYKGAKIFTHEISNYLNKMKREYGKTIEAINSGVR